MRKLLFTGILLFLTTTYTFSFCEVQKTELEYREKEYTKAEREYLELYERLGHANAFYVDVSPLYKAKNKRDWELEKYEMALEHYKGCTERTNNLFSEAETAHNKGDYLTEAQKYEELLKTNQNNEELKDILATVYTFQADVFINKEDFETAIQYLRTGINYNPKSYIVNHTAGFVYYKQGNINEALKYYQYAYDNATKKEDIDSAKQAILQINQEMQEKEEDKINQELAEKEELEKQEELKKQEELIKQEEEEKKQAQVTAVKEQELKINTEQAYKTIKESFFKKSVSQQKTILQGLGLQLEILKPKFSGEKLIIINHLIYLIDNDK